MLTLFVRAAAVALLVTSAAFPQMEQTPAARLRANHTRAAELAIDALNMPSAAPFFLEDNLFHSTLSVVNEGNAAAKGLLMLLDMQGVELAEQQVPLQGHSSTSIDIARLVARSGGVYGRVELFDDAVEGSALAGQVTIRYNDRQRVHTLDEELMMPSMTASHQLRGLAVAATDAPYIAVSNPADSYENALLTCSEESQPELQVSIALAPRETLLFQGCKRVGAPRAALWQSPATQAAKAGHAYAFEVNSTTPRGELQAFGIAPHAQAGTSDWTAVNFFDPDMALSPTTVFAGIPIGNTPELWGTYTPKLALHNFSGKAQRVTVRTDTVLSGALSKTPLRQLSLAPGQATSLDLTDAVGSNTLLNTLVVSGTDEWGGIAAQLLLEDSSQDLRFQITGKSLGDDRNIGMHPWHMADYGDNILLLYNESSDTQQVTVRIGNGQMVWQKVYPLAPSMTKRLSLRQMFLEKPKDDLGHVLSPGDGEGSFSWSVLRGSVVTGRLLRLDSRSSSVESFQCAAYTVLCNGSIDGPSTLGVGKSGNWSAYAQSCVQNEAPIICSGVVNGTMGAESYS